MTLATCFWILMLLALIAPYVRSGERPRLADAWPGLLIWLLLLLLGWAIFGSPIKT